VIISLASLDISKIGTIRVRAAFTKHEHKQFAIYGFCFLILAFTLRKDLDRISVPLTANATGVPHDVWGLCDFDVLMMGRDDIETIAEG
jgi:hypothetical protein